MTTPSDYAFRATPSASRYALVVPFLTLVFAYPIFLFLAVYSMLAKAIAEHSKLGGPLGAVGFGIGVFSFLTVYIANVIIFSITLTENKFSFCNGNRYASVPLNDIKKICYLDSLNGWMYIIVYTSREIFTLPKSLTQK